MLDCKNEMAEIKLPNRGAREDRKCRIDHWVTRVWLNWVFTPLRQPRRCLGREAEATREGGLGLDHLAQAPPGRNRRRPIADTVAPCSTRTLAHRVIPPAIWPTGEQSWPTCFR